MIVPKLTANPVNVALDCTYNVQVQVYLHSVATQ